MTIFITPPVRHVDVDWRQALCRTGKYDPDLWFSDSAQDQSLAALLCQSAGPGGSPCPIITSCLQYALGRQEKHGVWGGMTEEQRRVTGWAKKRVKCPSCRSRNVDTSASRSETCLRCGLSWQI